MKKTAILLSNLLCISLGYAGTLGEALTSQTTRYANLEASATWPTLGTQTMNGYTTVRSYQVWGGRFSAGVLSPYKKINLLGEVGGGYYGKVSGTNESGYFGNRKFTGYDVLVGALYQLNTSFLNDVDIFGSVGFMALNSRISATADLLKLFQDGGSFNGITNKEFNVTQVLPEIKVGGIYHLNENLGFTISYLHVFSNSPGVNRTMSGIAGQGVNINGSSDINNPALNTLLFGLRYYFV